MNWEVVLRKEGFAEYIISLVKYGLLAYAQGKVLTFIPKRDKYKVYWKITLTTNVANGEEEIVEED